MSAESSTLFVGNLSWQATEDSLRAAFPTSISARIVQGDGRSKGFGYVEFSSIEDARRALEANAHLEIDGRAVRLDFSQPREPRAPRGSPRSPAQQSAPSATLFVGNLSFGTNSESLKAAFPGAKSARLVADRESGRSRGFGYVEFDTVEAARAASDAMNGKELDGRAVHIDFAQAQSPSSRPARQQGPTNPPSATLFLGNLSYECDEAALRGAFADCGAIRSVRIMHDDSGASKGFGYLEFADVAAAANAIHKDGTDVCGRSIRLDYAQPRPERAPRAEAASSPRAPTNAPSDTLFLGGLAFSARPEDIREAFAHFGSIKDVRITADRETGRPKGFGYITFSSAAEAQAALLAMNGQNLCDRPLRLDFATPKSPSSAPRRERAPREDREEKERKPRRK